VFAATLCVIAVSQAVAPCDSVTVLCGVYMHTSVCYLISYCKLLNLGSLIFRTWNVIF